MPQIKLPDNIKPAQQVFTSDFQYVELPFPYLRLSWNNGNQHASKIEKAKYFGGFQRGEDHIQEDLLKMQMETVPSYFSEPTEWTSEEERNYQARSSRYLYAAPLIAKVDWYKSKDRTSGEERLGHRLDFLVYLANIEEQQVRPWGPAVISSHGYAASGIEDAFKDWAKDSRDARKEFAPGIDPIFFYHVVGTFGDKRITRPAGEKKVIVLCQYNHPETWTEEILNKLFVGEDIAAVLVDLQIQAKEWSEDTQANRQKAGKATLPEGSISFAPPEPEYIPDDPLF